MTRAAIELVPESGVIRRDGRFEAQSDEPWLRIEAEFPRSPFVEIVFRASLVDDPVRPVLRFSTPSGAIERILPGPVAGAGVWRGALPKGTHAVSISPTTRTGPFAFEIETIRAVSLGEMLARVWRRKPGKLWSFFLPTLFGYAAEAENALDWATNSEPVEQFEAFLARRERAFEPAAIDAPRCDWSRGPVFAIFVLAEGHTPEELTRTLDSIAAQLYPRLRLVAVTREAKTLALPADADFVCRLRAGDTLAPHALACLAEAAARAPQARLFYVDEIIRTPEGRRPSFKPGWSPEFERARPWLGRGLFVAAASLAAREWPNEDALAEAMRGAALGLEPRQVVQLRRWLLTHDAEGASPKASEPRPDREPSGSLVTPTPSASIILLTRDRPELLGPCLDSVLSLSTHPDFELVVVDNGSRRADTLAILAKAEQDARVRVLKRPGPFDFAAFNNEAAAQTKGEVLVFLNNDTIVLSPDWLEQLTRPALAPATGAVGALLTFPDGRVQHAGVVIGIGQDAGHFGALVAPEAPCWLDRTRHPHETTAVTAACMAVERRKFEAVGGFDAANLPIEFNDADLCLRLAERGWTNLYVPAACLIHLESASRGSAMFRPMSVYARSREYFRARWRKVIRDDPFHHPGLSLYARHVALW
ncbi:MULTISPECIES: glycosyltransferase family 2 protein [Methylosinus]|uniref:Glycosyl transferase family 2 n=1 Tax=Methylosinus trichosporium (strain ATCC 35070 / NCIMB 11131 / UNIQEM 75 / OB3b) TaxID=595536 RepID=A0A2D2CWI3_METT3|nr:MULTISPECIES: glycosyltransferase [Methylosinus]ATQ67019.1 glycosyl transferase family 2 [Methylosinus trichosporium OB3b]OBS54507.1 glycosyl transferase family 2 [Methylosinus sp. 3S-1]